MNDDEIIASTRDEMFRRNQGDVAQGRDWGVVIPALLRRIEHLPMNSKPTPELMVSCLAAIMQDGHIRQYVHRQFPEENVENVPHFLPIYVRLAREYAEALQNEYDE